MAPLHSSGMSVSTHELKSRFDTDGYLLVRAALAAADLVGIQSCVQEAVQRRIDQLRAAGRISSSHEQLDFTHRWQAVVKDLGSQDRRSWDDELISPELYGLMSHPRILDMVESLLGPEILATGMIAVRPKTPGDLRTTVQWHQDSNYFGPDTANARIITVWIPLVAATPDNGCLQVIPGSHHWGYQPSQKDSVSGNLQPLEDPTRRAQPVTLPMSPGDLLAFSNLTYHSSLMNNSDHTRWSIDLRYHAPELRYRRGPEFLPGFLARSATEPPGTWKSWQSATQQHLAARAAS